MIWRLVQQQARVLSLLQPRTCMQEKLIFSPAKFWAFSALEACELIEFVDPPLSLIILLLSPPPSFLPFFLLSFYLSRPKLS